MVAPNLADIFASSTFYQLSGLAGLILLFIVIGIREVRDDCPEGYFYLTVAVFLAVAHAVLLENALSSSPELPFLANLNVWYWLVVLLAPALIVLFVVRAAVSFVVLDSREGLVKLFFGTTLLCYLYMIGVNWPADVRGILTIVWVGFLFKTEMAITN
jgi:hypothetical protein